MITNVAGLSEEEKRRIALMEGEAMDIRKKELEDNGTAYVLLTQSNSIVGVFTDTVLLESAKRPGLIVMQIRLNQVM